MAVQNPHNNGPFNSKQVVRSEVTLQISKKERPTISNGYIVYSLEHEFDLNIDKDPGIFT